MENEEKFNYDIANLKKDFAIENMQVTNEDINMLRKYNNNEITMNDMISNIKKSLNELNKILAITYYCQNLFYILIL